MAQEIKRDASLIGAKKYSCKDCDYKAMRPNIMRDHINNKHLGIKLDCPKCDAKFSAKRILRKHIKLYHAEGEPIQFKCSVCSYKSKTNSSLIRHSRAMHDNLKHKCEECNREFAYSHHVKTHMEKEHRKIVHECSGCTFKSTDKNSLRRHFKVIHEKINMNKFCNICKKELAPSNFAQHMKAVHEGVKHHCNICWSSLTSKQQLKVHMRNKHPETLEEHEKKQQVKHQFSCEICEFKTFHKSSIKHHMKSVHHKEDKNKWCKVCEQNISYNYFKAHMKAVHEGVRFFCDVCDKSYKDKKNLKYHLKMNHPETMEDQEVKKETMTQYSCEICEFKSPHYSGVHHHMKGIHDKEKKLKYCSICEKDVSVLYYAKHIKSAHQLGSRFSCDQCNQSYTEKGSLQKHVKLKHHRNWLLNQLIVSNEN